MQRCPDITQAKALLGWEPRSPLRPGLQRTIAYFDELLGARRGANPRRSVELPAGATDRQGGARAYDPNNGTWVRQRTTSCSNRPGAASIARLFEPLRRRRAELVGDVDR